MRKGRSVMHKNLEDNYGAVVVANHEALAQVLDQVTFAIYFFLSNKNNIIIQNKFPFKLVHCLRRRRKYIFKDLCTLGTHLQILIYKVRFFVVVALLISFIRTTRAHEHC